MYDSVNRETGQMGAELEAALTKVSQSLELRFEEFERRVQVEDEVGAGVILENVLDLIYDSFGSMIPYDRIGLALVKEDGGVVLSRWARFEAEEVKIGVGYAAPLENDVVQEILGSGEPMIVNDLKGYLDEHSDSEPTRLLVEEGMRSSLTCPLMGMGKPTGLIVFSSQEAGAYSEEHTGLFQQVANTIAAVVERGRLYESLIDLNWQLRVAKDALEYQASHDPLTRLWNRAAIIEVAGRELHRASREEKPIAIVMADIDHFKNVNDSHGHLVGDAVLQTVAQRIAGALRSYETVGRYGGEEFMITLYDCEVEGIVKAMERLRTAVAAEEIETRAGKLAVTVSFGAAVADPRQTTVEEMISAADEALYRAKEAGRNRSEVASV